MKRWGSIVLIMLCLFSFSFALVSTKVRGAKLRKGPSEKYPLKMDLPKYYPLKILSKSGKWYKTTDWLGTRGWIYSSQLSSIKTLVVNKWEVNLRAGPGLRYRRIETLFQGSILRVIKKHGYWYQVEVVDPPKGLKGWIRRDLVWG